MRPFWFVLSVILVAAGAFAQQPARPLLAQQPPFRNLIGIWEGEGWVSVASGKRLRFHQTEEVAAKADGYLVVIEGTGKDPQNGKQIYAAYALVSRSQQGGMLTWRAYNKGNEIEVEPQVSEDQIIWGFEMAQGQIRYTIDLSDGTWHEVGEFSPDGGESWVPTFEMSLSKVGG